MKTYLTGLFYFTILGLGVLTTSCDNTADAAKNEPPDELGQALCGEREDCESEKERLKFQQMIEDYRKLLYLGCEDGFCEAWHHTGVAAMEGNIWCIRQEIW